ncbi:MAG: major capsid protein [Magnetococcales bacterium]|nr:major capsid protein [Magnetococcales bacterium]
MTDPFSPNAFSCVEMTTAINLFPNNYGRIREQGIFREQGVTTTTISMEQMSGRLRLLDFEPRGSNGKYLEKSDRTVRTFRIPHIPHPDVILAESFQNVRAFGSVNGFDPFTQAVAQRLQYQRNNHAITLEWLRMGALKGLILDGSGNTYYNLFDEFDIAAASDVGDVGKYLEVDFALDNDATNVLDKCLDVSRHIEANLLGDTMNGVRVMVDKGFFSALVNHPNVKAAFANWQAASDRLGGDLRKGFTFGGITFEEYAARATDTNGSVVPFINEGEGHAFPSGTMDTFVTYFGPANYAETINTPGLPLYARSQPMDYNKGVEIETQSNPLPICHRPAVLVKVLA